MRALENLKSNIEDRLDVLKEIRTQPLGVIEQKYIGRRHCYTIPSGYQIDEETGYADQTAGQQGPG